MVNRDEITEYLDGVFGDELLLKAQKKDEMANGIQIEGKKSVNKVAFGVSLNEEFLEKAVKWGADMCVFHHGLDTRTYKSLYSKSQQKRLKIIFRNKLTIVAYHYALDAHPDIGNNAIILEKLGAELDESFYDEWGYTGIFTEPKNVKDLKTDCEKLFGKKIIATYSGNKSVNKIGVCSGAAKPYAVNVSEMQREGVELFVSGETAEHFPHQMKENGINYFVCGHYATEVFGVNELANDLKKEFDGKMTVKFIDIINPI